MDSQIEQLHSRAQSLAAMFDHGNRATLVGYINEAIGLDLEALELCKPDHHMRSMLLARLAVHLSARYDQFGIMEDLEEAVVRDREALSLRPQGHRDRSISLNDLAVRLFTRYNRLGVLQDLEEAIVLGQEALSLRPPGHPDRSVSLNNLANCLFSRYNRLGMLQDLEEAIVLDRGALSLRPPGNPHRSASLTNLANHLSTRYDLLGELQNLEEAIVVAREALSLRPLGHHGHSGSLTNLAVFLLTRYNQLGALQDLEEAIVLDREALSLRPPGHPDRFKSLASLAVDLTTRYKRLGTLQNLEEAIVFAREALSLHPPGHLNRSGSLANLAVHLSTRFGLIGALQDLEEAISLDREALSLCPPGNRYHSTCLNNLAGDVSTRYDLLGASEDLEEAIVLQREVLLLRPQGHPDRPMSLNNLAGCLSTRYNKLGTLGDLEEAIVLDRETLSLCQQGHPNRSMFLTSLAGHLSARYNRLDTLQDLEEAIVLNNEALSLRPLGHPDRSASLDGLTICLCTRYRHLVSEHGLHDPSAARDFQEVFILYAKLGDISGAVSTEDLRVARAWIQEAEKHQHSSTIFAYETSLRFLIEHLSLLPTLPQHLDILKKHSSSLAVDAFSACLRNSSPQHAVELLEQGRSIFWNQLTRLHSPLDDVVASGPAGEELANEFTRLSSLIRKTLDSPGEDQHEKLYSHNLEMQGTVTDIRHLPGCSRFLLPSLFSDLRHAASEGPVIIVNASQFGCDALIIFEDSDPVHIPLSITKQYVQHLSSALRSVTARATSMSGASNILGRILRELWNDVVSPIVCVLQKTYPLKSRIWWCPTSEFSILPLHAAGPYRKGERNLASLYICSYTPTLSTLIHAKRSRSLKPTRNMKRFVGIGQANASGQRNLLSVNSELANIAHYVNDAATFTQIEGEESCIPRVAEELGKNEWVHIACHGLANRKKPFQSAFALSDGAFTIERIIRCNLEDPEFAYLSACHTTAGDEESPDEMIHLASAMQFIGFRSVIGTMWAVDDGETEKITSRFYSLMKDEAGHLDHTRAAYALNKTMRSIKVPLDQQVLYVHIGA